MRLRAMQLLYQKHIGDIGGRTDQKRLPQLTQKSIRTKQELRQSRDSNEEEVSA